MDVLIRDHHAVPASGRLPPAQALVNPKLLREELGSGNSELGTSPLPLSSQFPVPSSLWGRAAGGREPWAGPTGADRAGADLAAGPARPDEGGWDRPGAR